MSEMMVINDMHEAVVYLVHVEGSLKAARSLYYQVQHLGTSLNDWRAEEVLGELEEAGRVLNRAKAKVLDVINLAAFPVELDRI